ncbi:MAG: hypothetical protein GF333_00080 [Candidatus Omnitrophica bacterium]|nr:hypothetical protein [Candidatus Omnitrophota bacterium]
MNRRRVFSDDPSALWLILFLCIAAGMFLSRKLPVMEIWIVLFVGSAALGIRQRREGPGCSAAIAVMTVSLGAMWAVPGYLQQKGFAKETGRAQQYRVEVLTVPEEQGMRNYFRGAVCHPSRGCISRVYVYDYSREMKFARRYRTEAVLRTARWNRDHYVAWVKKDGVRGALSPSPIGRLKAAVLRFCTGKWKAHTSARTSRFLAAVFLGRRELLGDDVGVFIDSGCAHFLAVSGVHMGILALFCMAGMRLFSFPYRLRLIVLMGFLPGYACLTGMSPSAFRAAVMAVLVGMSFFCRRRVLPWNSLGLAGIILLFVSPGWIYSAGFQFSFLAVAAILFSASRVPFSTGNMPVRYAITIWWVSLWIFLWVSPLISFHFGYIYFGSLISSVVLIPLFTGVLLLNLLFLCFSWSYWCASAFGALLCSGVDIFWAVTRWVSAQNFSSVRYACSWQEVAGYYGFFFFCLAAAAWRRRKRLRFPELSGK